ncbi:MAG: hypothetical protein NTW25_10855 [Candidatus Kapabacteria bacterium]|nr:hypothetical protein [Candidatus Kapabacteria bacterium]
MGYWINLTHLNIWEMSLFGAGCFFWLLTYYIYIKNIIKIQFVEIPFIVVCMNIAWEFVWSFVFGESVKNYIGFALQIGYALWFFFDCFIFYGLYKYGYKQFKMPFLIENSKLMSFVFVAFFIMFFITMNLSGYDTPIGTISAYIDNIVISSAYIFLYLQSDSKHLFSKSVSWFKFLGTALISVALVLHWNHNVFLIFMTAIVFILDVYYLYILHKGTKQA